MAAKTHSAEVQHIVHLSTDSWRGCKHCTELRGMGPDRFSEAVNHYIEAHGYRLLHVGQETGRDDDGSLYHFTAAVVGR